MAKIREFIPFGEFLPDRKLLGNQGLLRALGVVPAYNSYVAQPSEDGLKLLPELSYGLGLHTSIASGAQKLYGHYGSATKLYEIDFAGSVTITDRSRATGYAFASTPPAAAEMWWFNSYADNVIATNFEDEVQYQATRGTAFADMITSTFKPQARFSFNVRQNLFLAYCFLPATYDGLASGTHPWLVVWSQNDNIRAFGSENVDPALIGAGYQTLGNDLGPITAVIGGDYGLVFQTGGITRIDGPPYEFRTIVKDDTTLYPYSVVRLGDDVYFWGAGGPSVLRGGEPPVERLAANKVQRSLLDNGTGFGDDFSRAASLPPREVSGTSDPVNELMRWSYLARHDDYAIQQQPSYLDSVRAGTLLLDYDLRGQRFSVSGCGNVIPGRNAKHLFLRRASTLTEGAWIPFEGTYGISSEDVSGTETQFLFKLRWQTASLDAHFKTGFGRLDERLTTKIQAVRPITTKDDSFSNANYESLISVTVETKNKPYEAATSKGPFTTVNGDGWIGTDDAVVGTYHSIQVVIDKTANSSKIHEFEGIEVQFVTGGDYGA